jgi:hypothetical protein
VEVHFTKGVGGELPRWNLIKRYLENIGDRVIVVIRNE